MMSHERPRRRLESCAWTTLLVAASTLALVLLLQAAHRTG
ncbi:hypothetical protein GCM10010420_49910 [Streptomyces glaucosporus]|uniref:Secreted protein n=1 Tax=Streptomyces glaucosporus TaxID=284044 RepID=A0ABN3IU57_9ACTN